MKKMRSAHTMDMTVGNISGLLVQFAIPLLAGNLFQLLYNTVDSVVVGRYVGKEALAAVGSTTPVINTLVGFFMGMAVGAGVVISQYFGAKDDRHLHEAIHTTMLATLILGVAFTFIGIGLTPFFLKMMSTPADVAGPAATYLEIYFAGILGLMIYNMGAGILRAVGDSAHPFYYLIVSSALNVVWDLQFVIQFHMGVAGVAYATILSQFISAILVMITLMRSKENYRFVIRDMKINWHMLGRIVGLGLPSGVQQAVTSFANIFVQGYINRFGSSFMAGWASYGKIDQFVLLPMQSMGMAVTTFVGQNIGAGKFKRVKSGINASLLLACLSTVVLTIPVFIWARPMISLFNTDAEVLNYGVMFMRLNAAFYVLCCANTVYGGALRGAGDATGPMVIMLSSFVVFRQIYLFVVSHITTSYYPIAVAYPVGWALCSFLMFIYFKQGKWLTNAKKIVKPAEES